MSGNVVGGDLKFLNVRFNKSLLFVDYESVAGAGEGGGTQESDVPDVGRHRSVCV